MCRLWPPGINGVSLVPAEPTSAIFALNILQYANMLDVLTISQNIVEGLILLVHVFYGSLVCVAGTMYVSYYVSNKEMLNFILTGKDPPSNRC